MRRTGFTSRNGIESGRRLRPPAVARTALIALVLTACGGVEQSSSTASDSRGWLVCQSNEWSVRYPAGWSVHPAEPTRNVAACALFAEQEFQAPEPEEDWGWSGAQVVLGLEAGCRGSFETVVSEEQLDIEGFPAWRRSLRGSQADGDAATAYEYVINLSPGAACEAGQWFYARTEADDPGSFAENRAVLDEMIATLDLSAAE